MYEDVCGTCRNISKWELYLQHFLFLRRFAPDGDFGGCEKYYVDVFKQINYIDNRVTLIVSQNKKAIFLNRLKRDNLSIKMLEFPFYFVDNFFERFFNMLALLNKVKPTSIVYIQGGFSSFNLADILAGYVYTKGRVYMSLHSEPLLPDDANKKLHFGFINGMGLWWHKQKLGYLMCAYISKKIIVVSSAIKKQMVQLYHFPPTKIEVVDNGVDVEKFSPNIAVRQHMRGKYNIKESEVVIISTSRLSKEKCLHKLISAFDSVVNKFSNCHLILIGEGSCRHELEELVNNKASRHKIKFLGFQDDVSNFLKMSDVYVLTSQHESFGFSLLEAMATGNVCMATKTAGPGEIINDGINGFLVEHNEDAIYKGLLNILFLNEQQRRIVSINAIKFVKDKFDIKRHGHNEAKILNLCQKLV